MRGRKRGRKVKGTSVLPGEAFPTVAAYVGLVHGPVVGADVVSHSVLALEALLTHMAGVGLLIRVG